MEAGSIVDAIRLGLGGVVSGGGLLLVLGGAIGVLRFPDFYTRLHAANAADGAGAVLVIIGLAIGAPDGAMAIRLILLALLVMAAQPAIVQLLGGAAHAGGLAPIAGKYTAPRPGAPRKSESL